MQNRHVHVSYTDKFRRDTVSSRPRNSSGGSRHNETHHDNQYQGEHRQTRPDWVCDEVGWSVALDLPVESCEAYCFACIGSAM